MAAQIMNNNQMVVTDALWHTYLPLLDNGTMNDLSILPVHQVIIGKHGINYLCARLASVLHSLYLRRYAHTSLGTTSMPQPP